MTAAEKDQDRQIEVTLFHTKEFADNAGVPENLIEAIAWLQSLLEQVPVEYRESATVEITIDEDDLQLDISHQRPETEAEKEERCADRQRRADMRKSFLRKSIDHLTKQLRALEKI